MPAAERLCITSISWTAPSNTVGAALSSYTVLWMRVVDIMEVFQLIAPIRLQLMCIITILERLRPIRWVVSGR